VSPGRLSEPDVWHSSASWILDWPGIGDACGDLRTESGDGGGNFGLVDGNENLLLNEGTLKFGGAGDPLRLMGGLAVSREEGVCTSRGLSSVWLGELLCIEWRAMFDEVAVGVAVPLKAAQGSRFGRLDTGKLGFEGESLGDEPLELAIVRVPAET
jgi:hypothetical protein